MRESCLEPGVCVDWRKRELTIPVAGGYGTIDAAGERQFGLAFASLSRTLIVRGAPTSARTSSPSST